MTSSGVLLEHEDVVYVVVFVVETNGCIDLYFGAFQPGEEDTYLHSFDFEGGKRSDR